MEFLKITMQKGDVMNQFSRSCRRTFILILSIFLSLFFFYGCSLQNRYHQYELSKTFDKTKFKRVGLLVLRMGNINEGFLAPITTMTDYSIRTPKREIGMVTMKEWVDVYIDDDRRLTESFPNYPYIRSGQDGWSKFYRNISTEVFEVVKDVLVEKDYQVSDIKQLSRSWSKPLSEMTINDILRSSQQDFDALFVLHYIDVGEYFIRGMPQPEAGFTELWYTIAMFDTKHGERVLNFRQGNFGLSQNFLLAMRNDPKISSDPVARSKITIDRSIYRPPFLAERGRTKSTFVKSSFTSEEILGFVLQYVKDGCKFEFDITDTTENWTGLRKLIP